MKRGFALALALLATILIAALLAAVFFAVNEETRTGSAIARRDEALRLAESALEAGFEQIRAEPPEISTLGGVESRAITVDSEPGTVHVTRLDSGLFWLVAVIGSEADPAAAPPRRIGGFAAQYRATSDSIRIVRVTGRGWSELF